VAMSPGDRRRVAWRWKRRYLPAITVDT
jgi:hypothetical protein